MPTPPSTGCSRPFRRLAIVCGLVAGVAAAASVTLRWRRADRVGRQQLKWFLAVLPISAGAVIAQVIDPGGLVNVDWACWPAS